MQSTKAGNWQVKVPYFIVLHHLLIKYIESTRANMKDLVAFSYKATIPKAIQEMTVFVPPSSVDK